MAAWHKRRLPTGKENGSFLHLSKNDLGKRIVFDYCTYSADPGRGLNGGFRLCGERGFARLPVSPPSLISVRAFPGLGGLRAGVCSHEKGNRMALYEHVYLARQDVTAQQVEALTEQLKGVIEANGGKVAKVEYWGVKSLAYRIKKNRKAHFTLMNIDAPSAAVSEMERQLGLNEDVLRILTLRVDELEEGQSAMLRKREDSDRDDRGDRGDRRGPRFDRGDRGGDRGDRGFRAPRPQDGFAPQQGEA